MQESRWRKVRKWLTLTRLIGLIIGIVGLGVAISGSLYVDNTVLEAIKAFYANAGSELISIAITVLVIDALNQRRATNQERDALILQMGSPDNAFAREAVRILRARGWLYDGSLQEADLEGANLQKATLAWANLQGAILEHARLHGADLEGANLQGAWFWDASFTEWTTLPDGTKWTPGMEASLTRFTDPDHSEFWRSYDEGSPANRGDDDDDD